MQILVYFDGHFQLIDHKCLILSCSSMFLIIALLLCMVRVFYL
jgi:hypothetical protein